MERTRSSRPGVYFEVEKVIGVSSDGSFQVQWAPAWVSKYHLVGCEHLIQEFLLQQQQQYWNDGEDDETHYEGTDVSPQMECASKRLSAYDLPSANDEGEELITPELADKEKLIRTLDTRVEMDEENKRRKRYANAPELCIQSSYEKESTPMVCVQLTASEDQDKPESGEGTANSSIKIEDLEEPTRSVSSSSLNIYSATRQEGGLSCFDDTTGLIGSSITPEQTTESCDNANSGMTSNYIHKVKNRKSTPQNLLNGEQFYPQNKSSHRKPVGRPKLPLKGHACPHCNKLFSLKSNLKTHLRTHTGERPFKCNQCGHSFAQNITLKRHIRTHTGDKQYSCNSCGKSFTTLSYLKVHNRRCSPT